MNHQRSTPPDPAELYQRGLVDHRAGRLQQAEAAYCQVLAVDPAHADSLHMLGVIAHQVGRNDLAIGYIRRAIELNVLLPSAHYNLGLALQDLGRLAEALASYRAALHLRPDYPEAHNNLGNVLRELRRAAEAEASYREALRLKPDYPEAHNNLGVALCALERPAEAATSFRAALRLQPDYAEAYTNLGAALRGLERPAEAEANYRTALRLRPNHAETHANLGNTLRELGRPAEAEASFREALRLRPDYPEAHFNLGTVLLSTGRFEEGWEEYEWRWQIKQASADARGFTAPLWHGEAIGSRVILLHAEQGLGDTLHFCRYVPLVPAGARVVLEVQPPLVRLLSRLPHVMAIVAHGEKLPPFDLHCPLLSLPRAFGTSLATIPAAVPYLAADPALVAVWRDRLAGLGGLRVGLVWASNIDPAHDADGNRERRGKSITLDHLAPLAAATEVSFISLQKGAAAAQRHRSTTGLAIHDWTDQLADFADTAALVENLDLVISIDTSVAHLAGALGKPVWLLSRFDAEWRWMLGRDDCPWYPTLRQFRQPSPGDWDSAIRRAADALQRLVASQAGRDAQASGSTRRATGATEGLANAHSDFGTVLLNRGRPAEAEARYREALLLHPHHADTHNNLGIALQGLGHLAEAEACYREALRLRPDYPDAHYNLANVVRHLGRPAEAEAAYREVLRLRQDFAEAHNNLANVLRDLGRPAEAEVGFREALHLRPDHPAIHNNLGNALRDLQRPVEAAASYRAALRLLPEFADAHNNLGTVLCDLGRPGEAEASYRAALRLRPDYPEAHHNLAHALLIAGRFEEGWKEYEWRWQIRQASANRRDFTAPQWHGEDIVDRVILLHAEQGLGDTLQFCRYVPLMPAGARIVLEVQSPLVRLLSRLPREVAIVAGGDALPPFDLHCPLLSLPHRFGTTLATIPAAVPYLAAEPALAAVWRDRIADLDGLRVGLTWASNIDPSQGADGQRDRRNKSMTIDELAPLAAATGVSFVSLQKGKAGAQMRTPPVGLVFHDWTDQLDDFADTAALVENLDLAITVDTAVAHLVGALGKPVWLLNRFDTDWRWLLDRDDCAWYPTMRQFRQPSPGDWSSTVARAAEALQRLVAGDRNQLRPHKAGA